MPALSPPACARCGYDRSGLPAGARCPECGDPRLARPWPGWRLPLALCVLPMIAMGTVLLSAILGEFVSIAVPTPLIIASAIGLPFWAIAAPAAVAYLFGVKGEGFPGRPSRSQVRTRCALHILTGAGVAVGATVLFIVLVAIL